MADDPLRKIAASLKGAGRGFGWSTLGLFCGYLTGIFVPDAFVSDPTLAYMGSALMLGLYNIGVLDRFRTDRARTLAETLSDIDMLFAKRMITDAERTALRSAALVDYNKLRRPRK